MACYSPAGFEGVGGGAWVLCNLHLLHLNGNVLQFEVELAKKVVPRLRKKALRNVMQ